MIIHSDSSNPLPAQQSIATKWQRAIDVRIGTCDSSRALIRSPARFDESTSAAFVHCFARLVLFQFSPRTDRLRSHGLGRCAKVDSASNRDASSLHPTDETDARLDYCKASSPIEGYAKQEYTTSFQQLIVVASSSSIYGMTTIETLTDRSHKRGSRAASLASRTGIDPILVTRALPKIEGTPHHRTAIFQHASGSRDRTPTKRDDRDRCAVCLSNPKAVGLLACIRMFHPNYYVSQS